MEDHVDHVGDKFFMTEPRELNVERYAFWFTTTEAYLLDFMGALPGVSDVEVIEQQARALVMLDDEFDPDEAWHWIRMELEEEVNGSGLDRVWREAIWLL